MTNAIMNKIHCIIVCLMAVNLNCFKVMALANFASSKHWDIMVKQKKEVDGKMDESQHLSKKITPFVVKREPQETTSW